MKRKLSSLWLALIITVVLFPTAVHASTVEDLSSAQKVAQEWLERTAITIPELSHWKGAVATVSQTYESLEGEVNAHMFAILSEGTVVGHILVGSTQYGNDILEAGTSAPPAIPTIVAVQEAIVSSGFNVDKDAVPVPVNLLYTGVDGFYAVYAIQQEEIAVNLLFNEVVPVSNLKPSIPSSAEYQSRKESTEESRGESGVLSYGFNYLDMHYWNGQDRLWCGPCSGVSIGAYYRDVKGYSNFPNNEDMYDTLYWNMKTWLYGGATLPDDYGPGWRSMGWSCGYYFNYANDWFVEGSDYWGVVSGIDSGWPTALLIGSQVHWRAIRGYNYWGPPDVHTIFCTNSQTGDDLEVLNFDALGTGLFTCRISN